MNFKNYKRYIVVDSENRPMSFDGDQFTMCNTHHARSPWPVKLYSMKRAMKLIRKSIEYRQGRGWYTHDNQYSLIPVGPKIKRK